MGLSFSIFFFESDIYDFAIKSGNRRVIKVISKSSEFCIRHFDCLIIVSRVVQKFSVPVLTREPGLLLLCNA